MSSYSKYCREQAEECARRARVANSVDVAANYRMLEARWRKLAEKATIARRRPAAATKPVPLATEVSFARRLIRAY
jgi:hypothetical protein